MPDDTSTFDFPADAAASNAGGWEDTPQQIAEEAEVRCRRVVGAAGTGKTYFILQQAAADPKWGLVTATTGISAVNVGAITIHSTLRYSDTASLRDAMISGRLARTLHAFAREYEWLVIEEYSMADGEQLDLWYRGVQEANRYSDVKRPMGIMLVGDLAQLPPVKAKWCFEANCWDRFAADTVRLEKVWRQDSGAFLDALNLMRFGKGGEASEILNNAGAKWHTALDMHFDGTTILPKNDMVNRFNQERLDRVPGQVVLLASRRWGQQRNEWGENPRTHEWGIPPVLKLKVGASAMILSNAPDFSFVNGDSGIVQHIDAKNRVVTLKLRRTGQEQMIAPIVRAVEWPERPEGWTGVAIPAREDDGSFIANPHFRGRVRRWVTGQVEYVPLRLDYATTVHKSQSLTLDRVQVDYRDWFFGKEAMLYVALSRCRTLEGLRLVGMREKFIKQCKADGRVLPWL